MQGELQSDDSYPGPADVEYFTQAQAAGWGQTLRSFAGFLGLAPGSRVLDAGTGPGLLPRLLAERGARLAVGCDDSPAMAHRAQRLGQGTGDVALAVADVLRLPFAVGAFDAATATNVLFLLPAPVDGLQELARVVRPGGTVAFLNPSETMSIAAAETFATARGLQGFDRTSFVNYGRLAEANHRLPREQWIAAAERAGLGDVRTDVRGGGLILFVSGRKRGET